MGQTFRKPRQPPRNQPDAATTVSFNLLPAFFPFQFGTDIQEGDSGFNHVCFSMASRSHAKTAHPSHHRKKAFGDGGSLALLLILYSNYTIIMYYVNFY
jgi:hypothetical protein